MIRTAFRKAAKACHPDHNAGDPTADQRLRLVISAYEILKNPQQRAVYDQHLRNCRLERVRRFAVTAVAGLASGYITVALVLWLSDTQEASGPPLTRRIAAAAGVSQPASQQAAVAHSGGRQERDSGRKNDWDADAANPRIPDEAPPHLQQSASNLQPAAAPPEPQAPLTQEWEQVQASGDPTAIWAFIVRNPDTPEAELARSKLVALIDAAEDVSLLHFLRLAATETIAERAQQRLVRLGALAVSKGNSVVSGALSSDSQLPSSVDETINVAKRQIANHAPIKQTSSEIGNTSSCSGFRSCSGDVLVDRGNRYLAEGNIAIARQYFARAARLGVAAAAVRMAETFEPDSLARLGAHGVRPDPTEADKWRKRALELGLGTAMRPAERVAE